MRLPLLLHISHSHPTLLSPSSSLLYLPLCILLPISPLRLWVLLLPYLLSLSVSFPLSHLLPLAPFAPLSPSLLHCCTAFARWFRLLCALCSVCSLLRARMLACSRSTCPASLSFSPSPSLPLTPCLSPTSSLSMPLCPSLSHSL